MASTLPEVAAPPAAASWNRPAAIDMQPPLMEITPIPDPARLERLGITERAAPPAYGAPSVSQVQDYGHGHPWQQPGAPPAAGLPPPAVLPPSTAGAWLPPPALAPPRHPYLPY